MAELRIERAHGLAPEQALALARAWVQQGEADWGLQCSALPCEGASQVWRFARTGVLGELRADAERFVLQLQLGFLLSAYQARIRREIEAKLDAAIRALS